MRHMPPMRHTCAPCETCGSTGLVSVDPEHSDEQAQCPTCAGGSRPCRCEAAYDDEGDRRYEQWRDLQDEREERIRDDD